VRITKELLISTAKDTVKRRTFGGGGDIVCAYITGSLTFEDPLIGGSTDIDLIFVHALDSQQRREIVPIADDFHLDIAHYPQTVFSQPRELRTDAWIGGFFCHYPIVVEDNNHWFDYVRSGVFAHFFQPPNILQRVRPFADTARKIWMDLNMQKEEDHHRVIQQYLQAIKSAANAIACLTSVPLTDRRLIPDFQRSAEAVKMPGLSGGLADLLLPADPIEPNWETWVDNWEIAFSSYQQKENPSPSFAPCRRLYYKNAILEFSELNSPAALWILLRTWSHMAAELSQNSVSQHGFDDLLKLLLLDKDNFSARLSALDQFLDVVEETIDTWQMSAGI
jgi:hypothetical protein